MCRLGYFELEDVALTQSALMSRIQKHYTQQAVLALYSVLLGLEVLGNPVGFVKGFKDGAIGLFYHPIQVAIHAYIHTQQNMFGSINRI